MTSRGDVDLGLLADLQSQFLGTIAGVDPEAPVPCCGRWRVRHLVVHLARIHHWAAGQARRQQEVPLGRGPFDLTALYRDCAAELLGTLAALDPDAPAWALVDDGVPAGERTGTVSFWHRRQKLETLVHLWDLRAAGGLDLVAEPSLWADCVDEVVTVMHPRQLRLGRVPAPEARIVLDAPSGRRWTVGGAPRDAPAVIVSAPERELALLLWGRAPLRDAAGQVEGEIALAEEVLSRGLTP